MSAPGELQVRRRRVPAAGGGDHEARPDRPAMAGGVIEHDGQHRHRQRGRRRSARQADGRARRARARRRHRSPGRAAPRSGSGTCRSAWVWVLRTSSAAWISPAIATTTPWRRQRRSRPRQRWPGAGSRGRRSPPAKRIASRRRPRPASGGSGSRSHAKAVSSITSVPCTTTAPSMSGSRQLAARIPPISSTWANVRCDAGTRPQSIGSISASSASPGTVASRSSPRSVGHVPGAGRAHGDRPTGEDDGDPRTSHGPILRRVRGTDE